MDLEELSHPRGHGTHLPGLGEGGLIAFLFVPLC